MAKKQADEGQPAVLEEPTASPQTKTFRVLLKANTPLVEPEMLIEATHAEEAKRQFCDRNGISDSTCEWVIEEI